MAASNSTNLGVRKREWTASACGRLLRPLQTSLASLHKASDVPNVKPQTPTSKPNDHLPTTEDLDSAHDATEEIFELQPRGRITYSARRRGAPQLYTAVAGSPVRRRSIIDLPTPFKSAASDSNARPSSSSSDRPSSSDSTQGQLIPFPYPRNTKFDQHSPHRIGTIAFDSFQRLLNATSEKEPTPTGARSLFSMAIRQIPDHIEDQLVKRRMENVNNRDDVFAETFDWLEDVSSMTEKRDDCLREAVRSQGIKLVQDAVANGLFEHGLVLHMAAWCAENGAVDAAKAVTNAFMLCRSVSIEKVTSPLDRGTRYQSASALSMIQRFHTATRHQTSRFAHLQTLLLVKAVPLYVLPSQQAARMTDLALRSAIYRKGFWKDAVNYLETILTCACGVDPALGDVLPAMLMPPLRAESSFLRQPMPSNRMASHGQETELIHGLQGTIEDVCITLAAMALIGNMKNGPRFEPYIESGNPLRALRAASLAAMRLYTNDGLVQKAITFGFGPTVSAVLMCDLIVTLADLKVLPSTIPVDVASEQLLNFLVKFNVADTRRLCISPNQLSRILTRVSVACEQYDQGYGFLVLKFLSNRLVKLEKLNDMAQTVANQVALYAALSFAQKKQANEHEAFAKELEALTQQIHSRDKDANDQSDAAGSNANIHWDEGLCEWITSAAPSQDNKTRTNPNNTPAEHSGAEDDYVVTSLRETHEKDLQWTAIADAARDVRLKKSRRVTLGSLNSNPADRAAAKPNVPKRRYMDFLVDDEEYGDELALSLSPNRRVRDSRSRRSL